MEYLSPIWWDLQANALIDAELHESVEDKLFIVNRHEVTEKDEKFNTVVLQCLLLEGLANLAKVNKGIANSNFEAACILENG